ncbi:MAG: DEAD/DEAH box helicase [Candidatus Lokiarchaeota archaeon]|nr:DEAD/DEAH box helicase [Candidatus Lokiarchaeota archaeon]
MSFIELGISEKNNSALKKLNILKPTAVQKKAIPLVLDGNHIMAQARTGSGKTLAFILPIVEQLEYINNEALILVPTRELAKQINSVIKDLRNPRVRSMTIYGGVSINDQIQKLKNGVNIIVGTPGRIIDLYKRRELRLQNVRFVICDEADRMFDMGFAPDVKYILNQIKSSYQFMLFSATLDSDMRKLVQKYSKNKFEFLNLSRDNLTVGNTTQVYYLVERYEEKFKNFVRILKLEKPNHALVFVNTKKTASWLEKRLKSYKGINFKVGIISGNLSQFQREKILHKFRIKQVNLLIATDVAARGLDIDNISHVFNYDIPKFPDNYIHRIGRTSRMSKKGVAITLCLKDEYEYLCQIEGLIGKEIQLRTLYNREQKNYHNPFY